jgi:hypothetical protein
LSFICGNWWKGDAGYGPYGIGCGGAKDLLTSDADGFAREDVGVGESVKWFDQGSTSMILEAGGHSL